MKKLLTTKSFLLSTLAIVLVVAIGGHFLFSHSTKQPDSVQQVRTVRLSYTPNTTAYLDNFTDYTIIEEETLLYLRVLCSLQKI